MIAEYNVNLENKTKSELILFIKELQDMLKEKDKEIEKKDKIIEQINKDIEANIYLAESNYNVEELNDYARGVYDTYINMRMQYFERKARDERD